MTWVAAGVGVGSAVGGSLISGLFGSSAASKNANAMRQAIEYQKELDKLTRTDLAPYRKFGAEQLEEYDSWLSNPATNPSAYLDPGYDFRLDQGNKGVTSNAATAGLLQSGDTLRGLTNYGQEAASQEYNNAFNRYIGEGEFRRGNAAMGQNASVMGGQLALGGSGNVGNITANTNFGGADQVWANVAGGLAGAVGNMFARRLTPQTQTPQIPGGSNVFGPYASGYKAPGYTFPSY